MNSILRYKKVYCDNKFKTPDSISTSDFYIELPETVSFDKNNCVFYLSDIGIPHSWYIPLRLISMIKSICIYLVLMLVLLDHI